MSVMAEIDEAQKAFSAALKDAEEYKKDIVKLNAEAGAASKEFGGEVKRVLNTLVDAQRSLEQWEEGYTIWIQSNKELIKDFAEFKKKSLQVEKFYNDLLDEKNERDKAKKKAGKDYKPTRADELADAVFKKAKTAYENDPTKTIETMLKDISSNAKDQARSYDMLTKEFKSAMDDYQKLAQAMGGFKFRIDNPVGRGLVDVSAIGSSFNTYFKSFG